MLKKEFDEKIKSLGLTRQDFCNITGLAYSSVSNWNDNNKPIPIWVDSWIENYKYKKFYEITKEFFRDDFIKEFCKAKENK
ncbi:hypothetical protein IMC75_08410 (plasmid) [Campylobacter peloridis]|uniref:XRE family transcriptional regulator n=2 Tax=Campylobacter peloridis TaxID=488546 RepID=A0ABX6TUT4_9BACT|nr:hypothetical protein [Campylobacter peloridis]AJC85507.1 hypothetical protein CPEL_a42 [Campylobacter peloridis LMG 23910]QOQ89810.1 hypothetical protein IMC75_08410 [Campylobacter peloridis]